jgi:hypothetical protein
MAVGIIFSLVYYWNYYESILVNKETKERKMIAKKIIAKKIYNIGKSNVVFIESSKQYAIPLHASIEGVSVLELSLVTSHRPRVVFSEEKYLLFDIIPLNRNSKDIGFQAFNQISSVAKDLYLDIEPQREDLKTKLTELKKLESLASFSELYKRQATLYSRASNQVEELLDDNENLSRECYAFILDILIGQELIEYNISNIPDVLEIKISLDDRCKKVSDQYQLLRSEMDEYVSLKK